MTAQQAPWADGVLVTTPTMTAIMQALGLDPLAPGWDGWVDDTVYGGWTYYNTNSFYGGNSGTGDQTSRYPVGSKISCTHGGVTKYGYVISATYYVPTVQTKVIAIWALADGTATTIADGIGITNPRISYMATPYGFPPAFAFTPPYTGWAATPSPLVAPFNVTGRLLTTWVRIYGTSNAAATTITLPFALSAAYPTTCEVPCRVTDNGGAFATGLATGAPSSATITFSKDLSGAAFTTSGLKWVIASLTVPI
jgi:hypothetical protein